MAQRFSASVAGRHMSCHASAQLDLAIPGWEPPVRDDTVGAKAAGHGIHKVIEDLLSIEYITPSKTTRFTARDMQAMARMLQYIGDLMATRRFTILTEATMKATWLMAEPETRADIVMYTKDEIHILDPKWGKIEVDPHENEQLLFYAATYGPLAPKAKGVTVHILQPRIDNMTSWFIDSIRLRQFMDDAMQAEKEIAAGDVTFGPSHHCTFCPANPHSRGDKGHPMCPAMLQILYPKQVNEDEILALD